MNTAQQTPEQFEPDSVSSDQGQEQDQHQPWATYALLAAMFLIYLRESASSPATGDGPDLSTLIAMGGVSHRLVVDDGQWFRMLTAAFLHSGPSHLFFNGLALFFGRSLERVIGAAWFVAIFVVSAVGGSALSIAFNAPEQVSVGASGAILGIFGAQLVVAYMRFAEGDDMRARLTNTAWRVLVPTLMSFTSTSDGTPVDFAAHLGGSLTGAAAGSGLMLLQSGGKPAPWAQGLAWLIDVAGFSILVYAVAGPLRSG